MKRKIFSILFALVLACSLSLVTAVPVAETAYASPGDIYVATTGNDVSGNGTSGNPYATIGKAISEAEADDTIVVAAGTYVENLVVDKALTLEGAQAGVDPTVEGARAVPAEESTIDAAAPSDPAIEIAADNVTIDGFTVTGSTTAWVGAITINDVGEAISGVTISSNIITGNDIGIRGDQEGQGVQYVTIDANKVTGNTFKAILFYSKTTQNISNITISGNEITDNGDSGISFYGIGPNTIIGNTVSGNAGNGISIKYDDGDVVTGNTVIGNDAMGINVHTSTNTLIENNTVSGHVNPEVFTEFWGEPLFVGKGSGIYVHELSENNTIRFNNISGNYNGVLVGSESGAQPSGNSVYYNNIAGNTDYGINAWSGLTTPVAATNNWWGDASGPYLVNGLGDKISPYVDARVWLDAPYPGGETTGLKVGESYNLCLTGLTGGATVLLDDIGNDALAPTDTDAIKYLVPDAFEYTLSAQGTKIISGVTPQYGTYTGVSETEDDEYIGLALSGPDELWKLEVLPADVVTITSDASFTYSTKATFTATVEKSGEPLQAMVEVYLDDTGKGLVEGFVTEGLTDSEGEVEFSLTAAQISAAGSLVLYVEGGDVGGLLGSPTLTDGIDDVAPSKLALTIGPMDVNVTTQPSQLFKQFETNVTVTATYDSDNLSGAAVILDGAGLDELLLGITVDGVASATITPTTTGTIAVTVFKNEVGTVPTVIEYLGMATIAVVLAEDLNVTVDPLTYKAGQSADLTVTIVGSDAEGPDGKPNTNKLNWAKVVVSAPVGQSLATGNWDGTDAAALLGHATFVDEKTIKFVDVLPNDASSDITVTVTGELDTGTAVAVTKVIPVSGYVVTDIMPDADQAVGDISDIALTVTTVEGVAVNNAVVTITALQTGGFKKDVNLLLPGKESFKTIVIDGSSGTIQYVGIGGLPETFLVNDGFYQVTGIEFAQVGAVEVKVEGSVAIKALFPKAFTVLGVPVYNFTFEPTSLTAGVDAAGLLKITITDNVTAAIDVATISVSGVGKVFTRVANVYTITDALLYTKAKTPLTVMAVNALGTKYGTATLEVGLPSVERTFTEKGKIIERNVMLTGQTYTVSVNVTDALGEPLDGYLWIGTYAGIPTPSFGPLVTIPASPIDLADNGTGKFDVTPVAVATLVWQVGGSNVITDAALVLEPSIAVQALSLSLDWIPKAPEVGEEISFTVTNNYGEPAGDISVTVVTPSGDPVNKVTTPAGVFKYTATEDGNYYVSVGEQDPVTVTVVVTRLDSITAPESVSLYLGETEQLLIMATYEDESTDNVTADATYASDNVSVATVSDAGLITAVAEGVATITVSYTEGVLTKTADVLVTVSEVPVLVSIAASPSPVPLTVDGTQQLVITAAYSDLTTADVTADATYATDNVSVATVSTGGLITAVAEGAATITVSYTEDEITKMTAVSVSVAVIVPLTIELFEGANPIYYNGATMDLPAALTNISEITEIIWQRDVSTGGEWWYYLVEWATGDITQLENGKVYIIVVSEDYTWELSQ